MTICLELGVRIGKLFKRLRKHGLNLLTKLILILAHEHFSKLLKVFQLARILVTSCFSTGDVDISTTRVKHRDRDTGQTYRHKQVVR